MKLTTTVGLLALALPLACASRPLKLRRVVLYQNGVGHFEHSGKVSKDKLRFFVKDYEVNDVLKTLTVVSQDGVTMTPTVHTATVDDEAPGVPPTIADGNDGDGDSDGGGQEQSDSRTAIDVIMRGGRGTNVSVSYAVPTPAWRATYRVVLPESGKGKTLLQGWAALQNTSDEDWEDVELVLATGAPFTYAIDLHSPRFVARPDLSGKLVRPANVGKVGASRARPSTEGAAQDSDNDRILDSDDQCPKDPETYNGIDDEDGCPDRGRVVVTDNKIEILDKVYFARGSALIRKRSKPIVDAIVATLKGNPDIDKIEIQGHTSDDERKSPRLARQRADAVAAALVEGGISHRRLRVRSYGGSNPVDPRKTETARAKNRRVEFLILARAGGGASGGARSSQSKDQPAQVTTRKHKAEVAKASDLAGTVRYQLPVRVSIPRGQSTLVPIVNRHVEGSEIYLYRPDSSAPGSATHPFRAARIVNSDGFELPSGPMAIFARGSFVGEGVLDKLFAGESAYIPYAIDSSSTVDRETSSEVRPSRLLSIRAGVAEVEDYRVRTTRYQIDTGKSPPSVIYIDHRVMSGYRPYRIPDGTDRSHGGLLVPVPLRPTSPAVVELMERREQKRRIALARWQSGSIADYLEDPRLPPAIGKGLREVVRLRKELAKVDTAESKANERRFRLLSRANQIRENLKAIGKSAPKLRRRLLAELSKLDSETKALLAEITRQDESRARLKAELSELAQSLDWTPE